MDDTRLNVPTNVSINDGFIAGIDKSEFRYFIISSLVNAGLSILAFFLSKSSLVGFGMFLVIETILFFLFKKIEGISPIRWLAHLVMGFTRQQQFFHKKLKDGVIIGINEQET